MKLWDIIFFIINFYNQFMSLWFEYHLMSVEENTLFGSQEFRKNVRKLKLNDHCI